MSLSSERSYRRIGEITTKIASGATPRGGKESYKNTGISLIRSMNVYDASFFYTDLALIDESQASQLNNVTVNENDILLNITGASVARCCMVPKRVLPARVNQHVAIIRCDKTKVEPFYLHYCLISPDQKSRLLSLAQGGATREALTKEKIESFLVPLPTLTEQYKISAILTSYDDLIENNTRRITILEEMAQRIYREWFVHFRYPGHENKKLVESELGMIPEGWEVRRLGAISDLSWGDTSTTKASYVDKGYDAYSASGLDGLLDHYDFDKIGIVLSAIGAQCGRTWLARDKWSCIKNTIRFWSKSDEVSTEFLFIATLGQDFWPRRGSAQPFISQGDAEQVILVIPDISNMKKFTQFTSAVYEQIAILEKATRKLRETRDLLLPKLISGQIDVSGLDIAIEEIT